MKENLNQEQQQIVEAEKKAGVDIIISNPILCKELIAELRANRKATEELTAKAWELDNTLKLVFNLPGASVG